MLYELCLLLSLQRVIGMELSGSVTLIYGLDVYKHGYKGIAWAIHVNKLEVTPTNLPLV